MKKRICAVLAAVIVTLSVLSPASSASMPAPVLNLDGAKLGSSSMATLINGTTYVSIRNVSTAFDQNAAVSWKNNTAYIKTGSVQISARPGNAYITVNGVKHTVPSKVRIAQGRVLVPIRTLADAFGKTVIWHPLSWKISIISSISENYNQNDLYWLSRIISSESRGETLEGQIAVGNVVLNRVYSSEFPNSIYGVIFDDRWGGQFEPVRNGTIYQEPTEQSVLAAKLCLQGVNIVGNSLYFLAPSLAQNFWIPQNKTYVTTIGCHDFYK